MLSTLKESPVINTDLVPRIYTLAKIIVTAREDGLNWMWSPADAYQHEGEKEWNLSSVDVRHFFDLDSHNDLEEYLLKEGFDLSDCNWDNESSAWYPHFNTKKGALKCIAQFDDLFDRLFLEKLKSVKVWA